MGPHPATLLSALLLVAFGLLVVSVISTPIVRAITIATVDGVQYGVFGYCKGSSCSAIHIGYLSNSRYQAIKPGELNIPPNVRHSISPLLIVHPIAAFLCLVCLLMAVSAHFYGPGHSSRFHIALLVVLFPTFLVTLLAFLVDILMFVPHLNWGGWFVLGSTVVQAFCGIVTCAMRRMLVSRKARHKRLAENAERIETDNMLKAPEPVPSLPKPNEPLVEQRELSISRARSPKLPSFAMYDTSPVAPIPTPGESDLSMSRARSPKLPSFAMYDTGPIGSAPTLASDDERRPLNTPVEPASVSSSFDLASPPRDPYETVPPPTYYTQPIQAPKRSSLPRNYPPQRMNRPSPPRGPEMRSRGRPPAVPVRSATPSETFGGAYPIIGRGRGAAQGVRERGRGGNGRGQRPLPAPNSQAYEMQGTPKRPHHDQPPSFSTPDLRSRSGPGYVVEDSSRGPSPALSTPTPAREPQLPMLEDPAPAQSLPPIPAVQPMLPVQAISPPDLGPAAATRPPPFSPAESPPPVDSMVLEHPEAQPPVPQPNYGYQHDEASIFSRSPLNLSPYPGGGHSPLSSPGLGPPRPGSDMYYDVDAYTERRSLGVLPNAGEGYRNGAYPVGPAL